MHTTAPTKCSEEEEKEKPSKKKRYYQRGMMTCGWTPKELIEILTNIIKKNPNIEYIEVSKNNILFRCDYRKSDFMRKKRLIKVNPSRRNPKK